MKITIARLLETAKLQAMAIEDGFKELTDYLSEVVEQTVRALKNGLTFADNFDCGKAVVSLKDNTAQVVSSSKTVTGVLVTRVYSSTNRLDSFAWYYDEANRLTFKASFTGSPSAAISVEAVLLFG